MKLLNFHSNKRKTYRHSFLWDKVYLRYSISLLGPTTVVGVKDCREKWASNFVKGYTKTFQEKCDINECDTMHNCSSHATCENRPGTWECTCLPGTVCKIWNLIWRFESSLTSLIKKLFERFHWKRLWSFWLQMSTWLPETRLWVYRQDL